MGKTLGFVILGVLICCFWPASFAFERGIYVTQPTAENTRTFKYLIFEAKKTGIKTFVVDVYRSSKRYSQNIELLRQNGIHYIARIVIFPDGGTHAQVADKKIWGKRLQLAQYAVSLGASAIQLDYIRYKHTVTYKKSNSENIYRIVKYFRDQIPKKVALQIDIFGVAAHRPSITIGQDVKMLANEVNAINPMVYPSHYEPFRYYATRPYKTVLESVEALKEQLKSFSNVKVYAYIELHNYRYSMSRENKIKYIRAQMQAARDAGANGWYAWSARNKYALLFNVLQNEK